MTSAAPYSVRVPLAYDLVRGVAQTITAPVYRDGAEVVCTAATVTILNASGTTVVTSASALDGSTPSHTLGAGDLTSESYGDGWQVTWSITTTDGDTVTSRHEASLCRSDLHPVITEDDLYQLHRGLDGSLGAGASITSRTTLQTSLDAAWIQIIHRLRESGSRAALVMSPSALRSVHLYLSLSFVFGDLSTADPRSTSYWEQSQAYMEMYEAAWSRLSLTYDYDDDGKADDKPKTGRPTIWLCGR